jgi:hypothetical protein
MLFRRIAAMPGASERDSPGVRSGSFITTSSAGDPLSYSPIFLATRLVAPFAA